MSRVNVLRFGAMYKVKESSLRTHFRHCEKNSNSFFLAGPTARDNSDTYGYLIRVRFF